MQNLNDIQKDLQLLEQKDQSLEIMKSGQALQQVKTQFTTALVVQQPRSMAKAVKNLLQEASFAGSSFYYRWPVKVKGGGQKYVQGPSIDLAMALARNYGNCVVDVDVSETSTHYLFKGTFIDLETGFTVPRLFRQRKNQSMGGKMDADRQEDIVFQIGHSKAQRNAIIKAMPVWLVEKLIETARESELGQIKPENLELSRSKAVEFFEQYGASQEMVEEKMGMPADKFMQSEVLELKDMAKALKGGKVTIKELFPPEKKDNSGMEQKLKDVVSKDEPKKEPVKKTVEESAGDQKKEPKEEPKEEPVKTEEKEQPESEKPWQYDDWHNMRGGNGTTTGFAAYVEKYKDSFHELVEGVKKGIRDKWRKVYTETPFPIEVMILGIDQAEGFKRYCAADAVELFCKEIFNHPSKFSDFKDGSTEALHRFINHLYVFNIEGGEAKLIDIVNRINKDEEKGVVDQYDPNKEINCPNVNGGVSQSFCFEECKQKEGCPQF